MATRSKPSCDLRRDGRWGSGGPSVETPAKRGRLVETIEMGNHSPFTIANAIREREADLRRVERELDELADVHTHPLAVIPTWVFGGTDALQHCRRWKSSEEQYARLVRRERPLEEFDYLDDPDDSDDLDDADDPDDADESDDTDDV
jgi:hypothetical protein